MPIQQLLQNSNLPQQLFDDRQIYLQVIRQGISGEFIRQGIELLGERELFIRLLDTNSKNLSRVYHRSTLSQIQTENILDTLRLLNYAEQVFDSPELAHEWLHTSIPALAGEKPIDLADTFEGRKLITETLSAIDYGEFS
jgi:uncharacterized protein (DUF2384 family)